MDFVEEFDADGHDFFGGLGEEGGGKDDERHKTINEQANPTDSNDSGTPNDIKETTDDNRDETENKEAELVGNHSNERDDSAITVLDARFVHVIDLERLSTDGSRSNIVIVAAKQNGALGNLPKLATIRTLRCGVGVNRHDEILGNLGGSGN